MKKQMKVSEVASVRLELFGSEPPVLSITAFGWVPSLGWGAGKLIPYAYAEPPMDGIYAFDFVAIAPKGNAPELKSPVVGHFVWDSVPEGLKGVKVLGVEGEIMANN